MFYNAINKNSLKNEPKWVFIYHHMKQESKGGMSFEALIKIKDTN